MLKGGNVLADQSYGLRFDIYERIHLSEDVIGIEELEEIELYPKIQVVPGEEYAALRGHLLLSGVYRGEGETRELEHYIPVEITIPLSRVNRLEDITVEIENFDVDLLSARSLNITGVLSLQGVETSALLSEQDAWKDREFTTAHVVSAIRGNESDSDTAAPAAFDPNPAESEPVDAAPLLAEEVQNEPAFSWNSLTREAVDAEPEQDPEAGLELGQQDPQVPHVPQFASWQAFPDDVLNAQNRNADEPQEVLAWTEEDSTFQETNPWADKESGADFGTAVETFAENEPELDANVWFKEEVRPSSEFQLAERADEAAETAAVESEASSHEAAEEGAAVPNEAADGAGVEPESDAEADHGPNARPEEKKEMKIALGAKKGSDEGGKESFGLTKLISSSPRVPQEALEDASDLPSPSAGGEQGEGEELRWKNLFISSEDQTPFRKVRLVIVQREETLDDIAQRYHLSSRELQLYNRLSEHQVNEGQVLYIP